MIFGLIVRQALAMARLPDDAAHLELGKTECNFIIQDLWYSTNSKYRTSRNQIVTIANADEYILNKYFDSFVKNTLQGPSNSPRPFEYLEPEIFFQKIMLQSVVSGLPSFYTFGDIVGFDAQLNSASRIKVFSSLASKTSGSVNVVNGSDIITSSADLFTPNDVGVLFQKSGDSKSYKIGKYVSPIQIQIVEKYRGTSATSTAYKIGDVGIRGNIQGFIGGQIDSEDVILDGSNSILTSKTFNTLVSLSKSDKTGGNITFQDSSGIQTVGVLAPGENEIERQTVLLWPKPSGAETLKYRCYMKHPWLWIDTDRLLIREKWHRLAVFKLEKRLRECFEKDVPKGLLSDIDRIQSDFENESEDLSMTPLIPNGDGGVLGGQFYFDKFRNDYVN